MEMNERVLVCGDREWTEKALIHRYLAYMHVEAIIEGEAKGADTLAKEVANELGIEVRPFPARWSQYGRAAGPIRNQQMLDEGKPTLVLAFHNDIHNSKGTKDMIVRANKATIPVWLISGTDSRGRCIANYERRRFKQHGNKIPTGRLRKNGWRRRRA